MARTAALPALKAESGLSHYLDEIRRFPMLEPQVEFMLAKRRRGQGDRGRGRVGSHRPLCYTRPQIPNASRPVMSRPTIRVWMSWVPS